MVNPIIGAIPPMFSLLEEIVGSKKGKWVRRLVALCSAVEQLRSGGVPNEDDPVLKAAEAALIRHLDKLHD